MHGGIWNLQYIVGILIFLASDVGKVWHPLLRYSTQNLYLITKTWAVLVSLK